MSRLVPIYYGNSKLSPLNSPRLVSTDWSAPFFKMELQDGLLKLIPALWQDDVRFRRNVLVIERMREHGLFL